MAELVQKYPDRFVGAVASLPMNDMDAALKETDRAIKDLHLRGIQLFTRIAGKPVDAPEFMPLYEKMTFYDLPIWMHPFYEMTPGPVARDQSGKPLPGHAKPDPAEAMDRAGFQLVYPSATAMTRYVYSHLFDNYPKIKLITHHCGCTIPYFADRIHMICEMASKRQGIESGLTKPVLDYYRMFYADTALHGNVPAMMCGYEFFGADHILFGTDMPFDAELGAWSIKKTVESVEQMHITASERTKIFETNAKELLKLD
jgi:uncharacterized protein